MKGATRNFLFIFFLVSGIIIGSLLAVVAEDVSWTLKYYEPRADAQDTALLIEDVIKGKFRIGTSIVVGE